MTIALIEPDLGRVSGGLRYNAELAAASGGVIDRVRAPGSWPHPTPAEAHEARALVAAHQRAPGRPGSRPVIVDGLIAGGLTPPLPGPVVLLQHTLAETAGERAAEERTLRAASAVIAPSAFAAAEIAQRYGIRAEAARPGVRTPASAGEPSLGSSVTRPSPCEAERSGPAHFICVGSVEERKNQLFLIRVLTELARRGRTDWRCTLAGPTADPAYAEQVRAAGGERITIVGELDGAALDTLYRDADLLLLPSLAETFGLVVLEAAAAGVPAFVTAGTGAEEALVTGRALPLEVTVWADALRQWMSDAPAREGLAASARERARTCVRSWEETARIVLTVLGGLS